jgi:hypothetical protein
MIQVKWELEGSDIDVAAAEGVLQRVLNYYQRVLVGLSCPAHFAEPWLAVRGRTLGSLKVTVESCCPALRSEMDELMRRVSRRDDE